MVSRNLKKALQVAVSVMKENRTSIDGVTIECHAKNFDATVGEWRVSVHSDLTMSIYWKGRFVADHIEYGDEVEFILDEEFYELGLYPVLFCTMNDVLYDNERDFLRDRTKLEELYNFIMNRSSRRRKA